MIVLIVFGPKRLPGLGRQLGSGMREFKESITGKDTDSDDDDRRADGLAAAPEEPRAPKQAPASPPAETVAGEARPQDQPAGRAD